MIRQDNDLAFMLKYENVAWYENGAVKILDRRVYPTEIKFVTCHSYIEVAEAIADMVTQSAGPYTAAGMGMALAAYECRNMKWEDILSYLEKASCILSHARPTTVERMKKVTEGCLNAVKNFADSGRAFDEIIFERTLESLNRRYFTMSIVAKNLVNLFPDNASIMTQCFGETIVGTMLREAKQRGKDIKLFVPETRPYFQGARLTASVARQQGFDTTVITDNMPAFVMKNNKIDLFTSAADVICMDGHVVNKIGTYQIALCAKYHGVPYFVTGIPDEKNSDISSVTIEYRDPRLVLEARGIKNTLDGVCGYYPSFDITPPHLVSGVVTDKGVYVPYNLKRYFETEVKEYY
ncbi:S-methyl-5-thioribose-1-phosphate isomerase [Peptoniphilus mikwangii]|uniref:S-methyl-5-thioribose-1-phosphate isomerase n=1 Tax=Peptoniphilus mikwangii TaxID=1354300 RepID=UPI0004092C76|nr:S-methyl-5-thioribose-1-phosphate isomerase [Peptoniphilus mikwangii]